MKNKTFIALISTAALLANLFIFAAASAADQTPLGDVTIDAGPARTLTSAPSTVVLSSGCTTGTANSSCTGRTWDSTESVEWADLNGSTAAYTITVTTTELSNSATDHEIGHSLIHFDANTVATTGGYTGGCDSSEGFTTGAASAFTDLNSNAWGGYGTGTSAPQTIVSAALDHDPMTYCRVQPKTTITVPAFIEPFNYQGTLTFSIT